MQAGKLNRQIKIQARSVTQDSLGQPVDSWVTRHCCWAAIATVTGKEVFAIGAGFSGQLSHRVTIRFTDTAITAGMRVLYGSKTFLLQLPPMNPDEANEELNLMCLEQS